MGKRIKKVLVTTGLVTLMLAGGLIGNTSKAPGLGGITAYASEIQVGNQWEGTGDIWKLKSSNGSYVSNSWVDDNGNWYLLDEQGYMRTDLIYDSITDAYYMLNPMHDGTYGKMLVTNGNHKINNIDVYLEFNQNHDGTYGKIITGLDSLKATGVKTTTVNGLPSASVGGNTTEPEQKPAETNKSKPIETKPAESGEYNYTDGTEMFDNWTEEDWKQAGGGDVGYTGNKWH